MDESSGVYEFVGIGELAETTTHLLALGLQQGRREQSRAHGTVDRVEQIVLQQARDYVRKAREGFMLSVRSSQVRDNSEVQFLVDRVMTDWQALSEELGLEDADTEDDTVAASELAQQHVERVRYQLLAFGMTVIAMGYLPRLPAQQVTFPHRYDSPQTYADIPVPSSPGEILWRIEELDQTVWRMMSSDLQDLVQRRYGPLRRTYGFFETAAWLSRREAERFGFKKKKPGLSLF